MHPRAEMFLHERSRAIARGDRGVERCMNVELERMGYREASHPLETATPAPMEQAVPEKPQRGGRPKLPRCEHDQIAARCRECNEDQAV